MYNYKIKPFFNFSMRLRNGSNPRDIIRFRSDTGKIIKWVYLLLPYNNLHVWLGEGLSIVHCRLPVSIDFKYEQFDKETCYILENIWQLFNYIFFWITYIQTSMTSSRNSKEMGKNISKITLLKITIVGLKVWTQPIKIQ